MRDPIDHLLEEHREIMAQVADLRRAVRDLAERGEAALPEALPALQAVGRMMATQLLTHARKEDEALFPALEDVFGTAGSPTTVMRQEHKDIHAQAALFRQTLYELNVVEHPAIVAGGVTLQTLATGGGSAEDLRATGERILQLLDMHFRKEEAVLFPMARQLLGEAGLREVAIKIAEIVAASVVG